MTGKSAFASLGRCIGFLFIAFEIIVRQGIIVSVGGDMFNVTALQLSDWLIIIGSTSFVLWAGETIRLFRKK